MATALGTSPLGIIDLAGIQLPAPPDNGQVLTPEEYYSSYAIKAAVYAIVTGLLLSANLIGKDNRPTEVRKAVVVDFCNRASIALAALGTGLYWLASVLGTNPFPYLQAFGTLSLIVLVAITVYIILGLIAAYIAFAILRWLYRTLKEPVIFSLQWVFGKMRTAVHLAWVTLRGTPHKIHSRTLHTYHWIRRRFCKGGQRE